MTARFVSSADGTPIALFAQDAATRPNSEAGRDAAAGPALLLVHGAAADHTTFRVVAPRLARRRQVVLLDRRGRGASGDAGDPAGYAIEREYEDVAAAAEALAGESGGPVDVLGHSYGGRCALGAALMTPAIRRVVAYEGAPGPVEGAAAQDLIDRLERAGERDGPGAMLDAFLRFVVGMSEGELTAYHANPVWPDRVRAAERTLIREVRAEREPAAGLARLGGVRQPVLLIVGERSPAFFQEGTATLAQVLVDGRVVVIHDAAHAAHHTQPEAFTNAVEEFLDAP